MLSYIEAIEKVWEDFEQVVMYLYYNSPNRIMLGAPKKPPPLRALNIMYPEKYTQYFVSIKINVPKPIRIKSNSCR